MNEKFDQNYFEFSRHYICENDVNLCLTNLYNVVFTTRYLWNEQDILG